MRRQPDQPQPLGELLRTMATRVKRVDLTIIEEIQQHWPTLVEPALATTCRPEFVKNRVLIISVPSGAFAQQIMFERDEIIRGLAFLNDRAPTSLKTVQKA